MERTYKMDKPSNTVNRIRHIFNELGLMTYEEYWKNIEGKIFSCGVTLEGNKYLRTLGKGMRRHYCLASGYGELMERIQNLILFTGRVGESFDKVLDTFPDTIEVNDYSQLMKLNPAKCREGVEAVCVDMKMDLNQPFPNRVLAGEFYSVMNDEKVYLPYSEILRGVRSNGMCAGNTFAEAVIEGMCELFERMAIKKVFAEKMIPPSIPVEYLKQFPAYNIIEYLQSKGVTIDVKDCSMDKNYPVLGILIINKKTGEYKYNFGAHPIFNRALERCLGEICQVLGGVQNIQEFISNGIEIDLHNDPYQADSNENREFNRLSNFYKGLKNSNGKLPIGFFNKEPTYNFVEWRDFGNSISFEEDLKILIKLLKREGKFVFIRDVSFLGFPAYYVYITEYSPVQVDYSYEKLKKYYADRRTDKNLVMLLSRIRSCSDEETLDLIDYINISISNPKYFNQENENNWLEELLGVPVKKEKIIYPEYVLSLLYLKTCDYQKSYAEFIHFFDKCKCEPEEKYRLNIIKEYLNLKRNAFGDADIKAALLKYFEEDVAKNVLEQLSTPRNIFHSFNILDYIDQQNYDQIRAIFSVIKTKIYENKIDQLNLRTHF